MRKFGFIAAAALALGLSACASAPDESAMPAEAGRNIVSGAVTTPLQCVPYARLHSDVKLYGDAYTWWDQAAGKFARGERPAAGSVMVLAGYAGPARAHVAVVRAQVAPREIRIDHANWLDDGAIYVNDPVEDVSPDNDWSKVRVWNIRDGNWGTRIYPVQGFIGPGAAETGGGAVAGLAGMAIFAGK
jgi:hypothetical protein